MPSKRNENHIEDQKKELQEDHEQIQMALKTKSAMKAQESSRKDSKNMVDQKRKEKKKKKMAEEIPSS